MRDAVYRSVNIRDDLGHPERLAHYHPTSRSAPIIGAVLKSAATMVIASYGSGKSLAAGIGALAAVNSPDNREFLQSVASRIASVDPALGEFIAERSMSSQRGKAVALSGYVRDLAASLAAAAGLGPCETVRKAVNAIRRMPDTDRVAIVWDEFGRHLEGLVMDGRARDLDALQDLSELVVRPSGPSISLTLLLHQNVLAYAQNLNQTSRSEWRKIEGRFDQMRFVEDSQELYGLISGIVSSRRPGSGAHSDALLAKSATAAVEAGWFDGMTDVGAVKRLLEAASPLSSAALDVLPRLVARVGQNERSLFAFLEAADLSGPVGMEEVYLAFSDAIRSDVGVGGLHRRWIEAESAMAKADEGVERELLAAAFLLQAGVSGERRRLRRATLVAAAASDGHPPAKAEKAIDALVSRKLLLHRKLNDDVSVWHGADVDVSGRLREERIRLMAGFDLHEFLGKEHPAPFVRPVRHNSEMGTSRYLEGSYAMADALSARLDEPCRSWGRVIYVICSTADDVRRARQAAATADGRDVVVIPDEPLSVADAALEIAALISLKGDERLMDEDPLVGREVEELLAIARRQLAVSMHRLTTPRPSHTTWHAEGKVLDVSSDRPAGIAASALMDGWFPLTPRIVNDQVVRARVSRQVSTARIRLITRLMDNADKPMLGYAEDDSSAEASLYRTVLHRTGIHVTRDGQGTFASPSEIADAGTAEAWRIVEDFFTVKGKRPLSDVVNRLSDAPVGLAAGVLPLLVLAGYKAFAKAVSIRTDGVFVRDILGFASTLMFQEPDRHEIEVHASRGIAMKYLDDFSYVFVYERPGRFDEKVIHANMAIEKWLSTVAEGARRSRRMPATARNLLRAVSEARDPATLILDTLPALLGGVSKDRKDRLDETLRQVEAARNAVDGLVEGYLREAVEVVEDILHLEGADKETVDGVHEWVRCFDVEALLRRRDLKMTDQTILRTVRDSMNGRYSGEGLARVVSSVLLQRSIDKWQDDTKDLLRKELRESRERIEAAALDTDSPSESLVPVIKSRIMSLEDQLWRITHGSKRGAA